MNYLDLIDKYNKFLFYIKQLLYYNYELIEKLSFDDETKYLDIKNKYINTINKYNNKKNLHIMIYI